MTAAADEAAAVAEWVRRRRAAAGAEVAPVAFDEMRGWGFAPGTGDLVHSSGRFFSVEGLHVRRDGPPGTEWHQPVIVQPENGILGMLVRRGADGEPEFLLQAKMEPGNLGLVQLSPTVQATRSNYTRVHEGGSVPHIEWFTPPRACPVLSDALQSEQGWWFDRKRNRNMAVEAPEGALHDPGPNHRWVRLGALKNLLRRPDLVNMDARSVLACLPLHGTAARAVRGAGAFARAAALSLDPAESGAGETRRELFTRLNDVRTGEWAQVRRITLAQAEGWHRGAEDIRHSSGRHFRIIAMRVRTGGREVGGWDQPLLAPRGVGVSAFLVRRAGETLQVLVRARWEPGLGEGAEFGPTVQCDTGDYTDLPPEERPEFLDEVLTAPPERVRYDTVQSEEGGRFYHARSRYMIVETESKGAFAEDPRFTWVTPGRLVALCRDSGPVNVQARTLLACLHTVW
ncbi:NDP-hexose 2,3-dehydratase family protein [Streptomonospora algeriensis]|uniref:NDP-hexose 2,3-dehydratase family protein n=1 Tax=Streptomonospora algeriensis TaxID=995084 RepID=A0ABW3B9D6_9ACTN